jgi:hypothetical protein
MNGQPEALRLAEWIEGDMTCQGDAEIAAELRRRRQGGRRREMSKHTPGPWAVLPEECDKAYIRIRGTTLGDRYKIANVITPMYEGVHEREAMETRANARLIAAAPELLEALKRIKETGVFVGAIAQEMMDTAIARAEGEQA